MGFIDDFNKNIAVIESLNISFYEKDLIRSAYYNHINNIPESKEAKEILNKYGISFRNKNITFRNEGIKTAFQKRKEIEDRKKAYKQHINATRQNPNLYDKNFLNQKVAPDMPTQKQSEIILQILANANAIFNDGSTLLNQCENILNECFTKEELSYNMINNIITQTRQNMQNNIKVVNDFLGAFVDLFDTLAGDSKKEILKKANLFIEKLQAQKNVSANLCIKLSSIKAHNALKKDNDFIEYLENTIGNLNGYIRE